MTVEDVQTAEGQPEEVAVDTEPDEVEESDDQGDGDTFPRSYVEKLRKESTGYRQRAITAEARVNELSRALFTARVEATGKLADPADFQYDADLLYDDAALNTAIDELVAKRPHYAKKTVGGSVGQGVSSESDEPFSLLGRLQRSV